MKINLFRMCKTDIRVCLYLVLVGQLCVPNVKMAEKKKKKSSGITKADDVSHYQVRTLHLFTIARRKLLSSSVPVCKYVPMGTKASKQTLQ